MTIYIVIRPSMDFDFRCSGAFSSYEEANKCAKDDAHDYEGTVFKFTNSDIVHKYIPENI
jgi:hypothetical protein